MIVVPAGQIPGPIKVTGLIDQAHRKTSQSDERCVRLDAGPPPTPKAGEQSVANLLHEKPGTDHSLLPFDECPQQGVSG